MSRAIYHSRASLGIRHLRERTPYVNWYDGASYENTQHGPFMSPPPPQTERNPTWAEEKAHGSRHILDTAPFALWDDNAHDYVLPRPSQEHAAWIFSTYNAKSVSFHPPFLLVATETPALPQHDGKTSLTIGCAPVVFAAPATDAQGFHAGLPYANANPYMDRLMKDPLIGSYEAIPWVAPSAVNAGKVFDVLKRVCNIHALNFVWPNLVVELVQDQRIYQRGSLPSRLGGWLVEYHHGDEFWNSSWIPLARRREISAEDNLRGDTSNYLNVGDGILGPGIRVEGRTMSTTAGVRVRRGSQVRITLANQGFEDSVKVFHPDGEGEYIAHVEERHEDYDWALAKLSPSVSFSNSKIFECPAPTRLLRSDEITREWFICDGMTTGKIAMLYMGNRFVAGKTLEELSVDVDVSAFKSENIYFGIGPTGGSPAIREGICGAAIINEGTGGIAGFCRFVNADGWCLAPQLDKLVADGWDLY